MIAISSVAEADPEVLKTLLEPIVRLLINQTKTPPF